MKETQIMKWLRNNPDRSYIVETKKYGKLEFYYHQDMECIVLQDDGVIPVDELPHLLKYLTD